MEIHLKQRLIGAVVIFTLLIIFLPMIFENDDEQKYVEQILEPQIPKMVESDGFVINKSALNQDIKNVDDEMKTNKISSEKIKSVISDSQKNKSTTNPLINSDAIYKKFEKYKDELGFNNNKQVALSSEKKKNETEIKQLKSIQSNITETAKLEKNNRYTESTKSTESIETKDFKQTKVSDSKTEVYALLLGEYSSETQATKLKEELIAKGYPVYISKKNSKYHVYIGPELELQYIQDLSRRVLDETDYKPKIVTHSLKWLTE